MLAVPRAVASQSLSAFVEPGGAEWQVAGPWQGQNSYKEPNGWLVAIPKILVDLDHNKWYTHGNTNFEGQEASMGYNKCKYDENTMCIDMM